MNRTARPFLLILTAIVILALFSLVPWSTLTGRYFKDFNLLSDLWPSTTNYDESEELIDPQLAEAMHQAKVAEPEGPINVDHAVVAIKPARVGGTVVIEDYSPNNNGLRHFRAAINSRNDRPARIAVIGDSYIEGDIFTQDVRALLQSQYGGRGPGYVNMHSDITGFRQSVRQSGGDGWKEHDIRHHEKLKPLSGQYFTSANAEATYKGTAQVANAKGWNSSRFLFIAPTAGNISYRIGQEWIDYPVLGSDSVQELHVPVPTELFAVKTNIPNLTAFGVWLGDDSGIQLDCMSLRGNSGLSHRDLSIDLAKEMRQYVDYDLIVIEYGINALEAKRNDYSFYSEQMVQIINRVRAAYPNADVLLMGIGDRGHKQGGEVHSMPTAAAMVTAQREAARRAQCLFWDTREAMGGDDAIVDWRARKLVNGDYIHLNHQGGAELARLFVEALTAAIY